MDNRKIKTIVLELHPGIKARDVALDAITLELKENVSVVIASDESVHPIKYVLMPEYVRPENR